MILCTNSVLFNAYPLITKAYVENGKQILYLLMLFIYFAKHVKQINFLSLI